MSAGGGLFNFYPNDVNISKLWKGGKVLNQCENKFFRFKNMTR